MAELGNEYQAVVAGRGQEDEWGRPPKDQEAEADALRALRGGRGNDWLASPQGALLSVLPRDLSEGGNSVTREVSD